MKENQDEDEREDGDMSTDEKVDRASPTQMDPKETNLLNNTEMFADMINASFLAILPEERFFSAILLEERFFKKIPKVS